MALMRYVIELGLPHGATPSNMDAYVLDALCTWKGSLQPPNAYGDGDPGDPMFNLDSSSVKIKMRVIR